MPTGPAIILVHVASTNIPFTSESKEAVAHFPEIEKEIRLSLQQCARTMLRHLRKQEKKEKVKDKFMLISKILPQIANKTAETLGKPVPLIDEVIAKIMDIVWIEDKIHYEKIEEGWKTSSHITITNYKDKTQKFFLFITIPHEAIVDRVSPQAETVTDRYIKWKIGGIDPHQTLELTFELRGIDKGDFDENDIYIEGLDPVNVIGAEKWEGD